MLISILNHAENSNDMKIGTSHPTAVCPECARPVRIAPDWEIGHLLLCPHCEIILAVSSLQPITFDWAFEEPIELKNGRLTHLIYNPHWHFHADS